MKVLNKIFCLIFLIFCVEAIKAQSITWNRTYDGPYHWYDESYDICQTTDGNLVAVGYTRDPNYKVCVLKINNFGDTLWFRIIPSSNTIISRVGNSIEATNDGGCIITGENDSLFAAKFNSFGNLIWLKNYGSRFERGWNIFRTQDNFFIICGEGGLILKIDELGNKIWKKYLNADRLYKGINGIDNGYVFTGFGRVGSNISNALLIKVDTSGNLLWESNFMVNNATGSVSVDKLNNTYIIGGITNIGFGNIAESFVLRTNLSGFEIFRKSFTSKNPEYLKDLKVINDNKIVICSDIDKNKSKQLLNLAKIFTIDTVGNILISKTFNFVETQSFNSIEKLENGDLIFCGSLRLVTFGGIDDIWIVRTDSLLNSPSVNINLNNIEIPSSFKLFQNYPNPFNPETIIKFTISKPSEVRIDIFDILGKKIEYLVNEKLNIGEFEVKFNGTNINSGVYFYSLYINKIHIDTKKMFLLK